MNSFNNQGQQNFNNQGQQNFNNQGQQNICRNCGAPLAVGQVVCSNCGAAVKQNAQGNFQQHPAIVLMPRSIAVAIVLSIVTCGIYGIYWFVKLTDELNVLSGRTNDVSGGKAFLFTLITCGIYSMIWAYKSGEKVDVISGKAGGSTNVLYLVLSIFGLGIIVYALAQDTVNKRLGA